VKQALDYTVRIEPFHEDRLQVVWTFNNSPCKPYYIDRGDVVSITENELRPELRNLVNLGARGQLSQSGETLRKIAHGGHRLYRTFFLSKPGGATQAYVNRIRDIVAAAPHDTNIGFFVSPRLYVPWALMYETREQEAGLESIAAHSACWGLRYGITTIYDYLASPLDLEQVYDASRFATLCAGDASLIELTKTELEPSEPEASFFRWLEEEYGPPVVSADSLLAEWNKRKERLGILYLYCHANQTKLGFSHNDFLDTIDFKTDYQKADDQQRCLVFLNGCHTAAGDRSGGFLEATGRDGFCGFVGAETTLPYMFAHRFGAALISKLYDGMQLIDIMTYLRRSHWPLSLAYGLYAYPFLRLNPDTSSNRPTLPGQENYSASSTGDRFL
jgi:hypothetical protein